MAYEKSSWIWIVNEVNNIKQLIFQHSELWHTCSNELFNKIDICSQNVFLSYRKKDIYQRRCSRVFARDNPLLSWLKMERSINWMLHSQTWPRTVTWRPLTLKLTILSTFQTWMRCLFFTTWEYVIRKTGSTPIFLRFSYLLIPWSCCLFTPRRFSMTTVMEWEEKPHTSSLSLTMLITTWWRRWVISQSLFPGNQVSWDSTTI